MPNIDYSKAGEHHAPEQLPLAHVVDIVAGGAHACALVDDGTVRCWGLNYHGQLGDGTTTYAATPVVVIAPT